MPEPTTIQVDDVKSVREDSIKNINLPKGDFAPFEMGEEYHVETCTKYFLGKLVLVTSAELCFVNCSWVEDTGRYNQYLAGSKPCTNEPFPSDVVLIISRGALVSCVKRSIIIEVI